MNEHPTPESYNQELAAQAKHEAKHPDLMQLLCDLHPTVKPTERHMQNLAAQGRFGKLFVSLYTVDVFIYDENRSSKCVFSGGYAEAQAWLKERLG